MPVAEQTAATPSMSELRQMAGRTVEIEATKTVEPAAEVETEAKSTESESGTEPEKQQEEKEDELPVNVQKRIAAEAKKAAFFQSKIDQAISNRKKLEAEAAKLTGTTGSEPAKTTEPAKDARPKRPDLASFTGTLAEFNKAVDEYETKFEEWLESKTRKTVTQELSTAQQEAVRKSEWDKASEEYGEEFPGLMDSLRDSTPPEFQIAVSALDDWARVAVHLAKNEADRDTLVELFKANPTRGAAELGKLEDRIKPAAKAAATEGKTEKKPLKAIAGGALGTARAIDLDKAPMSVFKQEINRKLGNK